MVDVNSLSDNTPIFELVKYKQEMVFIFHKKVLVQEFVEGGSLAEFWGVCAPARLAREKH